MTGAPTIDESRVVIASNRGPFSFGRDDVGRVVPRRGAGGLVTALIGALQGAGGLWIASAMTDDDRIQAARGRVTIGEPGATSSLRYLSFDPDEFDAFYNDISNRVLWMLHHCLWDAPRTPVFDRSTRTAWEAYRRVNRAFAEALEEEGDADFLIQDYHLALAPTMLRERRPDARIAHFSHIPFAGSTYFRVLPRPYRLELLQGMLGADVVGFHSNDWAENFLVDCRELPGATVNLRGRAVRWKNRTVRIGVYPISIDVDALRSEATTTPVGDARRRIEEIASGRALLLRVDRAELSKNILRGFLAFDRFLEACERWRGRVIFLALLNPSREEIPEYRRYVEECLRAAETVNERFGTSDWRPVVVSLGDDFPMAIAGYERYDALMVNPVFDGMNLVAKEGPTLNRRHGVLILSENAGAFPELGRHAVRVSPFDVEETAEAIRQALEMPPTDRARHARGLRAAVHNNRLDAWVARQRMDLRRVAARRSS
jgi:trehalose 6-phosphate synthase